MIKTVVELDLVGYSDKALELEEHLGVDLVMQFNDQIQRFINTGLAAAGLERETTVFTMTGDGAILLFDDPTAAHHFAKAVHEACDRHNRTKSTLSAHRWFRIGAATGEVSQRQSNKSRELAGITISNAVRLESADTAGHFLIDLATFAGLPKELQQLYEAEEEIAGKRNERIRARRCIMVDVEAVQNPQPVAVSAPDESIQIQDLAQDYNVGDIIEAQYVVERHIKGGMSSIYVVTDNVTQKRYVLKSLDHKARHTDGDDMAARFEREATVWVNLDYHPHIVQAHTFLHRPQQSMLLLEFVDGPSLAKVLKHDHALVPRQAISFARQFSSGMEYVHTKQLPGHQRGILHRDIKPGNILFTRTAQLKITDFGLAKLDDDRVKSVTGQFMGTVNYSSPEQLRDAKHIDRRAEIFSFGIVLYEMLTGMHPFPSTSMPHAIQSIQFREPDWSPVLPLLRPILQRCLEKSPDLRYNSFLDLDHALAGVEEQLVDDSIEPVCTSCGFLGVKQSECSICQTSLTSTDESASLPPNSLEDSSQQVADPLATTVVLRCQCGAVLKPGSQSCGNCGKPHPQCQCINCGTWNLSTNSYCNFCGSRQVQRNGG